MEASVVAVREAATVMLVRDAPALEVFMLRRNPASSFAPDAYVFPGGQVDAEDSLPAVVDRTTGVGPAAADASLREPGAVRFYVAALRESFEEAGVLVARSRRTCEALIAPPARLAEDRARLLAGECDLVDVLDAHDASLDLGALVPFARWISPLGGPQRFDAWYFVASAPDGHAYEHDDDEMVASEWVRPGDMLARQEAGEVRLVFPTIRSLLAMRGYETARSLLDATHECWSRPDPWGEIVPGRSWQLNLGSPCPT